MDHPKPTPEEILANFAKYIPFIVGMAERLDRPDVTDAEQMDCARAICSKTRELFGGWRAEKTPAGESDCTF